MGKEILPMSGSRYECTREPFGEQSGRRGVNTFGNDPPLGESKQATGSFLTGRLRMCVERNDKTSGGRRRRQELLSFWGVWAVVRLQQELGKKANGASQRSRSW